LTRYPSTPRKNTDLKNATQYPCYFWEDWRRLWTCSPDADPDADADADPDPDADPRHQKNITKT